MLGRPDRRKEQKKTKRLWCSGNINPFQGLALDSISSGRTSFWCLLPQSDRASARGTKLVIALLF